MTRSIQKRIKEDKKRLLEILEKTPVIQVACQKAGIGRATYYRWRKEDKDFAAKADATLTEGISFINDMAESQIISGIREKNLTATIFWLKNRHKAYSTRIEVTNTNPYSEELTPEQEKLVTKALTIAKLLKTKSKL